jgi:hypothetical protein
MTTADCTWRLQAAPSPRRCQFDRVEKAGNRAANSAHKFEALISTTRTAEIWRLDPKTALNRDSAFEQIKKAYRWP